MDEAREPIEASQQALLEEDHIKKYMIKLWDKILASARQFN